MSMVVDDLLNLGLRFSTLTDISKSVALYLHDDMCPHRAMSIELCSRGFHIWQNYTDAMELLRSLFRLASASPKEATQTRNLGQLARTSVLQIAASNTPLFITTISLDIMDPESLGHRSSTMQLVAFVIRKVQWVELRASKKHRSTSFIEFRNHWSCTRICLDW
jgi:rabconnectin-3b